MTVPGTHRIAKLLQMVHHNGANLIITEWVDDHAEMLSEWEAESRYNMDFVVENKRQCSEFDLNCYYIMFAKRLKA